MDHDSSMPFTVSSQPYRIFIFATATDINRVNQNVVKFFEHITFSIPTTLSRRNAIEMLYKICLKEQNSDNRKSLDIDSFLNNADVSRFINDMADLCAGHGMRSVINLCAERIIEHVGNILSDSNTKLINGDNSACSDHQGILPLTGVCGHDKAKDILRELIIWPRVYSKVTIVYTSHF